MTSDRIDDDVLRARLDRLVPTPDDMAGWTGVRRGVQRAHQRRRGMVVAGAGVALTAALVGGVIVASSGQSGDQRLRMANPPVAAAPHSPTTYGTIPGGPGSSAAAGSIPDTGPSSPAGAVGGSILAPSSATTPAGSAGTPPGSTSASGDSTTVVPGSTPTAPDTVADTNTSAPQAPATTAPAPVSTSLPPTTALPPVTSPAVPAVLTIAQVQQGVERLAAQDPDLVRSIAKTQVAGRSVVAVTLRADGQQLAQEITSLWPSQTVVRVGFFVYGSVASSTTDVCPAASTSGPSGLALTATAALNPSPIPSGDDFTGTLTITNHGTSPAPFATDLSAEVDLLPPGSGQVVGCYDGTTSSVTVQGSIAPGQSANFAISGGTASANRGLGYSLPAGGYIGLVHITINGLSVPFTFPVTITG